MAFKRFEGQPLAFFCPDGFRPERILVKYNYAVYFVVHPYLTVRQGQRGDFRNPLIPGPRGPRGSLYGGFFSRSRAGLTRRVVYKAVWLRFHERTSQKGGGHLLKRFPILLMKPVPGSHSFLLPFAAVISLSGIEIIRAPCCRIDGG